MTKFDFNNRTAVITGGAQGFGLDIAKRFLNSGAKVIIWDIDEELLKSVVKEVDHSNLSYNVIDVSNFSQIENTVSEITSKNQIDILINNAGITGPTAPLWEYDVEQWKKVVDVNLNGAFLCAREAMKIMVNQKSGRIINIGSISGQMSRPENAPYTATKFAIEGLTRALALDGRDHGVAVSVIHPGNAATNIWKGREEISEREGLIPLEDLGKLAVTMLTMSPNVNILGSVILPITQPYLGRG